MKKFVLTAAVALFAMPVFAVESVEDPACVAAHEKRQAFMDYLQNQQLGKQFQLKDLEEISQKAMQFGQKPVYRVVNRKEPFPIAGFESEYLTITIRRFGDGRVRVIDYDKKLNPCRRIPAGAPVIIVP